MAKQEKMSKTRKITIILASILAVLMIGVCLWWVLVYYLAPEKMVSNTWNLSTLTTSSGETRDIVEVDYYSNKNKNGLEKLDVKWNYFHDESRDSIYSQGLQYIAKSSGDKIRFNYQLDADKDRVPDKEKADYTWFDGKQYYNNWGMYRLNEDFASRYNYQSYDDYVNVSNSTNPLGFDSRLKIQIGDEIYAMKFKGNNSPTTEFLYQETGPYVFALFHGWTEYNLYYAYYDFDYFSAKIYDALQAGQYGKDGQFLFEFGDMFDYYKYDSENKVYSNTELKGDAAGKVIEEVKTYFSIKINVHADGAQKASEDSIFHMLHGNYNYNLNPDRVEDGYFVGRSIINCSLYDFELVKVHENNVALKLKEGFVNYYKKYKDTIVLDVVIDIDELEKLGYTYFGLATDNGLKDFDIYKIITQQTIDGQLVKSEVTL